MRRTANLSIVKYRLLAFLAVLGPGFITANVDNDPGGILTYSQAGAKFGYALLWTLIPTTIALIVVQEMAARMGAVTGKGLSDLIREEFGLRATFITMAILSVADFGNIAAEFAGLASGMGVFGVSKYIAVPIGAALVWIVIVRGRYKPVERLLILFSLIYFTYPLSAFLAKPDWKLALHDTFVPTVQRRSAIPGDDRGLDRHHHHAVDAVLPASLDRRERRGPAALRAQPFGRDSWLRRDRRDRLLHRGCLRGHHLQDRPWGNQRRRRSRSRVAAVRRTICDPSVRRRTGQRVAAVRGDPAAGHGLQRLRRPGLRIRHRPAVFRSADFLLALHAADRRRARASC